MTGRVAVGSVSLSDQNWLFRLVNRSGAVSPATRATPSINPVRIPCRAAGTTTVIIVRVLVAPRASDASRRELGMARTKCSVPRSPIGIIDQKSVAEGNGGDL